MKPHGIDLDSPAIRDFCRKWKIRELSVFGSVLRDDFRPDSDIDFLADYEADAEWEIEDLDAMDEELGRIVGRKAELVDRRAVERSPNYIRRRNILRTAERLHVQR
jgi:uncharacterized protein